MGTNEQVMDFQKTLLKVEQSLNREDVQALVFLCADLLAKDVSCISTGRELFTHLQELDLLTPERPFLLAELLHMSKRIAVLRKVGLVHLQPEGRVSSYRKLLFDLAENITAGDLKEIKFLLQNTLPRRKLDDDMTMLRLLLEMEKQDHLSATKLKTLEDIIGPVCPNLKKKIIQYKENNVVQETGVSYVSARPAQQQESSAYPGDQMQSNKDDSSYGRPANLGYGLEHGDQYRREVPQPYASSQEPCALSSLSAMSPVPLDTPDARMEGVSLSQCSSSGKTDSTFSSVQNHSVYYTSSFEEKNLSAAEPNPGKQEPCALSSLSAMSPVPLDTPDARMEGVSLSQCSSSGKTDSTFSSEQSHNVSVTSSCEKLRAAEPSPEKEQEIAAYAMNEDRTRGVCLIINNYDFSKTRYKSREGTDIDQECLVKVFDWLGFETRTKRDCTLGQMHNLISQLSKEDHSNKDCLVCCLLSHGELGVVCGVDGGKLSLKDLTQPFSGASCATLLEKPKLFFIQACQGMKEQQAVPIQSAGPDSAQPDLATDAVVPQDSIPNEADFLLGMATVPDFASFRHKMEGTWFIQSLCENLLKLVPRGHDLLTILTQVNDDVSKKTFVLKDGTNKKKQMPQPAFSLRKRVVFPVPSQPPPKLKEQPTT